MKKTLLVIAAAAMILGLAGCNGLTKNGLDNDSGSWKKQKPVAVEDDALKGTVVMTIDGTYTPTWSTWTGINGQVLNPEPTLTKDGNKWTWKFDLKDYDNLYGGEDTENMVLYISSSDATKDYRGRICVYRDKSVEITYSNKYEEIAAVGIVTIKNDEPLTDSLFPTGNYSIKDIYPLDPATPKAGKPSNDQVGGTYVLNGNMRFEKVDIVKNKSISFPVKAGDQIIGIYQPNRKDKYNANDPTTYTVSKMPTAEAIKTANIDVLDEEGNSTKKSRADLLEITTKGKSDAEIVAAYVKENAKLVYGEKFTVTAHSNKFSVGTKTNISSINSSDFGTYWFVTKSSGATRMKAAGLEEYFVSSSKIEK